ncbi:class I SAM-dependent methyltransferase [bacterium]|nr:class I SAM-dependent methyltransferase [candidate division CSSED10-310 bacterium]
MLNILGKRRKERRLKYLASSFRQLGPWVTNFVIDGVASGGVYDPCNDPRMPWFFEDFPNVKTILDLGCLEGAQSFSLAERPSVVRVLGLDARPANIERANFIKTACGIKNVRFARADLETVSLMEYGRFDAVFCCGVLYHLPEPWRLIEQIAAVTDRLFVWTHYAAADAAIEERAGYRGAVYREFGWDDAQSGVSPESFWLVFDDLMKIIDENGFEIIRIIEKSPHVQPGPITTFSSIRL